MFFSLGLFKDKSEINFSDNNFQGKPLRNITRKNPIFYLQSHNHF